MSATGDSTETTGPEQVEHMSSEDLLEMIITKEDELKKRVFRAEAESRRVLEEAKMDATALKRDASSAEVGKEIRERELEKAREEAERVASEIKAQAGETRKKGMEQIEQAVEIIIDRVLPRA